MKHDYKVLYRDFQVDLIKTISIFGVVMIHTVSFFEAESHFNLYISSLFRFSVPCFIILWAYYFEKSYFKKINDEKKSYILKKLRHLFKVFFMWSILYFFTLANWHSITLKKIISTFFLGYGWSGQYFFIILFQLLLVYPVIRFLYTNIVYRYFTIILLTIIYILFGFFLDYMPTIFLTIGNRFFVYWIPYVFTGIYLLQNTFHKIPVFLAFSVFLIIIETLIFQHFNLSHDVYITPMVFFASIFFCLAILKNNFFLKLSFLQKWISYLGANTMIVFVANPIVIYFLKKIANRLEPFKISTLPEKFLILIVLTTLIIVVCLLLNELLIKLKLKKYLI